MLPSSLWAPAWLLLAQPAANYELSVSSELRARPPDRKDATEAAAGDVELAPRGEVGVDLRSTRLGARYSPKLLFREPYAGKPMEVFHSARAALEFSLDPVQRAFAAESFGFGATDFTSLGGGLATPDPAEPTPRPENVPTVTLTPQPTVSSVVTVFSDTQLAFFLKPTALISLTPSAGYSVSGGADRAAQDLIPLGQGPRAQAKLGYSPSRRNTLESQLSVSHTFFTSGRRASVLVAKEGWRHRLSERIGTTVEAGASALRNQQGPAKPATLGLLPVAGVGLDWALPLRGQRLQGGVSADLSPYTDPFVGTAYERTQGSAFAAWKPTEDVGLLARASGAVATLAGSRHGEAQGLVDLGAQFDVNPNVQLGAGYRNSWQRIPRFSSSPFHQWLVLATLTLTQKDLL